MNLSFCLKNRGMQGAVNDQRFSYRLNASDISLAAVEQGVKHSTEQQSCLHERAAFISAERNTHRNGG